MKKLTSVLVVETIEPCLNFWVDQLGFEVTVKVNEGERLGFVILQRDALELMLQSHASVAKDVPYLSEEHFHTAIYIEVEDLEEIKIAVQEAPKIFDERKTFYGAREIAVRDPAGNVVTFAQMGTTD